MFNYQKEAVPMFYWKTLVNCFFTTNLVMLYYFFHGNSAMLLSEMSESVKREIRIDNVNKDVLKKMISLIRYIYCQS